MHSYSICLLMVAVIVGAQFVASAPMVADEDEFFELPMRRLSSPQRFGLVPFPRVGRSSPFSDDDASLGPKRAVSFPAIRFGKRASTGAMFPAIRFGKRANDDFDATM